MGALWPPLLALGGPPHALTHLSYLSGLLLGIGLAFWSLIPRIETRTAAFTLLTLIVVVGGLARLVTALRLGAWTMSVTLPLVMELGVMKHHRLSGQQRLWEIGIPGDQATGRR